MTTKAAQYSSGGIGAFGVLGIIFVLAKIFAIGPIAAWSWWLVLLPFYLGFAIAIGFMLLVCGVGLGVIAVVFGGAALIDLLNMVKRKRRKAKAF